MRPTKQIRAQLEAAYTLMQGDTTTIEKFEKIKSLLMGVNPSLDNKLTEAGTALNHLQAALNSDIIHLTGHALPQLTPADKKRKKLLLLFITSWKSLNSEVTKVRGYYDQSLANPSSTATSIAKTGLFAKGPFGLITLAAVAVVGVGLFLRHATTTIDIQNSGCPPLIVPQLTIKIPGLTLPEGPIVDGSTQPATLPNISVVVQSTRTRLTATALGQTVSYAFPSRVTDVRFDDASLLDQTIQLKLNNSRTHSLVIQCR